MNVNINQNLITYTGEVKIKIFKNGKYFKTIDGHNSGTVDFLKFIRDCVAGKTGIYARIPFYIQPITIGDEGLAKNSFSAVQDDDSNEYSGLIYTFLLSGINYSGAFIKGFKLFGADNTYYAWYELPEDVISNGGIELTENTNLYVEWSLKFRNNISVPISQETNNQEEQTQGGE